jgi:hypothetical protein
MTQYCIRRSGTTTCCQTPGKSLSSGGMGVQVADELSLRKMYRAEDYSVQQGNANADRPVTIFMVNLSKLPMGQNTLVSPSATTFNGRSTHRQQQPRPPVPLDFSVVTRAVAVKLSVRQSTYQWLELPWNMPQLPETHTKQKTSTALTKSSAVRPDMFSTTIQTGLQGVSRQLGW